MKVNPNIQKHGTNYREIKTIVWDAFDGEEKFKKQFPLSSNRSIIYKKVKNGEDPQNAAKNLQDDINNDLHVHAQQNAKKKHQKGGVLGKQLLRIKNSQMEIHLAKILPIFQDFH